MSERETLDADSPLVWQVKSEEDSCSWKLVAGKKADCKSMKELESARIIIYVTGDRHFFH